MTDETDKTHEDEPSWEEIRDLLECIGEVEPGKIRAMFERTRDEIRDAA